MAVFRSLTEIDMTFSGEGTSLDLVNYDERSITFSDGYFTEQYLGAFQYNLAGDVLGRLDRALYSAGTQTILSISGIGADANAAFDAYFTDPVAFLSILLARDDRIV